MAAKRIVSFLPSATELIYELGAGNSLFGVTHECLYPEQAKTKPRIINSVFDPEKLSSRQIDEKVSELAKHGNHIFTVHEENLRNANPDLIIAQGTCEVCAAYTNEVDTALRILQNRPQVEVLDPHSINDILASVMTIAKRIGREKHGEKLVDSLQKRIDFVKGKRPKYSPRVLCIEWIEPFFTSGHWVPQMIDIAGGSNLVSTMGAHSRKMTIGEVESADADIIIMMPCGFDTKRTTRECLASLRVNQRWNVLRAVKSGNVYAVDANSYFSKPSIRTITGIEILAKIFHPSEFSGLAVPDGSYAKIKF